MKKEHVKPILLSAAQVAALKAIQEQERQKSGFGIAPSIHDVARKIFDVGLSRMEVSVVSVPSGHNLMYSTKWCTPNSGGNQSVRYAEKCDFRQA